MYLSWYLQAKAIAAGLTPHPDRIRMVDFPVPRQQGGVTCGYFVLHFAHQLCEDFETVFQACLYKIEQPRNARRVLEIWDYKDQKGLMAKLRAVYQLMWKEYA